LKLQVFVPFVLVLPARIAPPCEPVPRTFKLTVAYDGTAFAGWQLQARQRTVQGVLEEALKAIDGERVVVHAAGRTDAGAHAAGQVISFSWTSGMSPEVLLRALNAHLDRDVRVMRAEEARDDFNARFDPCRKTYQYAIWNERVVPPQRRHFVWHVPQPLGAEVMNDAAAILIGEHDFSAFQAAGGDVITTRRQVFVSRVVRHGAEVIYEVTASGFLRHMVRNIVGTLVDIGKGRRSLDDMRRILDSRDRTHASATAPAHGLTLWSVEYEPRVPALDA
jgi:tRNA pseudouridine38-40 synthase